MHAHSNTQLLDQKSHSPAAGGAQRDAIPIMALVAVQTSPFPGMRLTLSAPRRSLKLDNPPLSVHKSEARETRCWGYKTCMCAGSFGRLFLTALAPLRFFPLRSNLRRIPGCQVGEGLLLCKTLQREKLSSRFELQRGVTCFNSELL